jgi:membrane-associated phospholipid phosphatase
MKSKTSQIKEDIKDFTNPSEAIPNVSKKTIYKRSWLFNIYLIIISISAAILTILAKKNPYFATDLSITRTIQSIQIPWFDTIMNLITFLGNVIPSMVLLIVTALIIYQKKRKLESKMLLISTIGIEIISTITKFTVARQRPDPNLIKQVGKFLYNDSFPSGHVLFFVGFFGFLLFLAYTTLPKNFYRSALLILLLLLLILIGISRIYLGAHWFSDVLGAYLIGFLYVSAVCVAYQKIKLKNV